MIEIQLQGLGPRKSQWDDTRDKRYIRFQAQEDGKVNVTMAGYIVSDIELDMQELKTILEILHKQLEIHNSNKLKESK